MGGPPVFVVIPVEPWQPPIPSIYSSKDDQNTQNFNFLPLWPPPPGNFFLIRKGGGFHYHFFWTVPLIRACSTQTLIIQKISKKLDFCHFFKDVLSLGWGGMGVLWCNRLNYSFQMGQIWPRMTDYDPGWHTRGHGGTRGCRGGPGGTRGHQGGPGYPRRQKER